jgi:hypothetical protein
VVSRKAFQSKSGQSKQKPLLLQCISSGFFADAVPAGLDLDR